MRMAMQFKVRASIVFMGFLNMQQCINNKVGSFIGGFFQSKMDNTEYAVGCKCPTLVIHGKKDTLIPVEQAMKMKHLFKGPCSLVIREEMTHYSYSFQWDFINPLIEFFAPLNMDVA